MTYIAVAVVMFVLGYLVGTFGAAVGIWAEREKAQLVIDGMAEANRGLLDAVRELVHATTPPASLEPVRTLIANALNRVATRGMH